MTLAVFWSRSSIKTKFGGNEPPDHRYPGSQNLDQKDLLGSTVSEWGEDGKPACGFDKRLPNWIAFKLMDVCAHPFSLGICSRDSGLPWPWDPPIHLPCPVSAQPCRPPLATALGLLSLLFSSSSLFACLILPGLQAVGIQGAQPRLLLMDSPGQGAAPGLQAFSRGEGLWQEHSGGQLVEESKP
ncbi:uncharacterized protein LOC132505316 [Lagenorhynchus albirostris]|uniref:uncharacterized protein LOC132505316 n=1 Tax=Lagenorhynchus albirostris TaxID=27610 RepID=UPI0028E97CDA|nr:uncharacterized protein LOC132505316 [Lagenorhynchus albirostris]